MLIFKTIILMETRHEVTVECDSIEDVQDAINDLDNALLVEEIYGDATWSIEDLNNIIEVK